MCAPDSVLRKYFASLWQFREDFPICAGFRVLERISIEQL
jgi:hypothetical protein